jgi:acyl carrier protein
VRDDGLIELHGTLAAPDAASVSVWRGVLERCLLEYPGVAEAYVTSVPRSDRMIAFVVAVPGLLLDEHKLLTRLATELPQHMIPAAIAPVSALPLRADGQVDDGALPWPQPAELSARRPYLPPRNALERLVTATWAELFDRDQVSVEDNFFDLGGHSLSAVQLLGQLGVIFGVQLPVSTLFSAATPAGLAMALAEQLGGQDAALRLAADIEEILRLPEDEVQRASDRP